MAEINEIRVCIGNYGYCNEGEPTLKQSLAARGIAWDRARGAKSPAVAIAAAKDAASKGASAQEVSRSVAR